MPTKDSDPLAGLVGVRLCTKCRRHAKDCQCDPDTPLGTYHSKPAVRKAMVEWLRQEANADAIPTDRAVGYELLADRLEKWEG